MTESRGSQGRIVAFNRSAAYLRRRAQEQRRRGARVEAVELMRLALQRQDTAGDRLLLAVFLREMGNNSQAAGLLYPLCAQPEPPPDAYFQLALCLHGMGNMESAKDALQHELWQNPEAEDARELLAEWMFQESEDEVFRLGPLMGRAYQAERAGNLALARRRMRRAVRIAREQVRPRMAWAAMELEAGNPDRALPLAAAAWRREPENPRPWSLVCLTLQEAGKSRCARGFLRRVSGKGPGHPPDELVRYTALRLGDYAFLKRYMEERTRREDGNVFLLNSLAEACWQTGERERAHALWGRVLRIAPEDMRARGLRRLPTKEWQALPAPDAPPEDALRQEMERLMTALMAGRSARELLAWDSPLRPVTLWALTAPSEEIQRVMLAVVARGEDTYTRRALRALLALPGVLPQIREQALGRLHALGETGQFTLLLHGRLSQVSFGTGAAARRSRWRFFMRLLLLETRQYGQSRQIIAFAANVWRRMTPGQRELASGVPAYAWVKAMEAFYLHSTGQDAEIDRMIARLPISVRRVGRALRAMELAAGLPETAEGDEQT